MKSNLKVTKRNGSKEGFDIVKVKQSIAFACENVDVNPLELESRIDYFLKDGIKTSDIQLNIIEHAKQLASAENPEWLLVAGHAFAMHEMHNSTFKDKSFYEVVKFIVGKDLYVNSLLEDFTKEEINELGEYINFDQDLECSYAALVTNKDKYQNKYELNQHMHMVNSMRFAQTVDKEKRLQYAKDTYDTLSKREFSLATPFMNSLRSGGNLASCFILSIEDDIDSIFTNIHRIAKISKNGGGIGIYLGNLRAKGSSVGKNENASNTIVQWVKIINDTLVAVNQGGRRAGAGTVALPVWHNDLFDFLDMQTEHGDIRMKAYDVFPQIVMHDLFMQRDRENGDWTTFCPFEVKKKLGIDIKGKYGDAFENLYLQIEKAANDGKLKVTRKVKAREVIKLIMRMQFETGLPYIAFVDTINRLNPNKNDPEAHGIPCVNLCVAPNTQILTDVGYITIGDHVGEQVNVWNGSEFSNVIIKKTGENQKLLKVSTSSGQELECTEYHKFYVSIDYRGTVVEKSAVDLKVGDKLIKLETPIIEGDKDLMFAYDNGFFTADGCESKGSIIYLYDKKMKLEDKFESVKNFRTYQTDICERKIGTAVGLKPKFFVPLNGYTIKSRLDWFAGLCDGDGTIARNGTNEALQICSINKTFLLDTQLMLQTLGIQSKVTEGASAGFRSMPANDGTGENKEYYCQQAYRLLVSSSGLYKLANLGFKTHRLEWSVRCPQRNAEQFTYITNVIDEGVYSDTYCFNEPLRHLGVFNGLLTGQCNEQFSNVVADKYAHVCNLGSINMGNIRDFGHLSDVTRKACRILNAGIDLTKNPDEITEANNKRYRTIGIGVMGLHDYLAREFTGFNNHSLIAEIFECIEYNAIAESVEIAKERGSFEAFEFSEWKNGNMTNRFKVLGCGKYDWDWLQSQIEQHGLYNSQVTSPAPTTSTSISQDASASVLPTYSPFFSENNKTGSIKVSSRFLKENPVGYGKTQAKFSATEIIDAVSEMQKFVDTGISMELIFDQNKPDFKAKDLYDAIHYAHAKGIKAIYYIRSVKQKEQQEEACVACAG